MIGYVKSLLITPAKALTSPVKSWVFSMHSLTSRLFLLALYLAANKGLFLGQSSILNAISIGVNSSLKRRLLQGVSICEV